MATQFTTQDANGETITLQPGEPFQTFWEMQDGQKVAETISHPWNALDVYGPDDLARFCITATTIPDPPAPRAELPKSTVIARLNAIGMLAPVWTILNAQPLLFAQWFAPDWPNVYCDDAGMLQVLAAAGLSTDQIVAVTAHG